MLIEYSVDENMSGIQHKCKMQAKHASARACETYVERNKNRIKLNFSNYMLHISIDTVVLAYAS